MSLVKPATKTGKIYNNPIPTRQMTESVMSLLMKSLFSKEERVPKVAPGPFSTDTSIYKVAPKSGLRITWIGHSSLIIEIDGKRILTDPVWGPRASFSKYVGPKRFFYPPLPLKELPPIDLIILSHDHYDHLDYPTIKQLTKINTPIFCSIGVGGIIEKWGIQKSRISEMDWTTCLSFGSGFTVTATPARHFSGRGLINRHTTLWSSFVIKGPQHKVFFGADSGYFPGFKDIGDEFGPFDLTMLEIGASGTGWPDIHMGPTNAAQAHLDLGGKIMMPIHWGTFNLAFHAWREPIQTLQAVAAKKDIALFMPKPGTPTEVVGMHNSAWWE